MGLHIVFNFYHHFPDLDLENMTAIGRSQNLGKSWASDHTMGWHSRVGGCLTAETTTFLSVLLPSSSQCPQASFPHLLPLSEVSVRQASASRSLVEFRSV